jgi:hypothetical protein
LETNQKGKRLKKLGALLLLGASCSVQAMPWDQVILQRDGSNVGIDYLIGVPSPGINVLAQNGTTRDIYYSTLSSLGISAAGLSGSYTDLSNKPTFATVATSGNYSDLFNLPSLSTVAVSGAYADLSGKPTIPAAQVNSDWNASSGIERILNKPSLASVATSGVYSDLSGKPSLATVATSGAYADLSGKPSLATVATTGAYSDLTGKPSIPAAQVNSDWSAGSGVAQILNKPSLATVATSGSYTDLSNKPSIPGAFSFAAPTTRTLSLATAYQGTTSTAPTVFVINITSTSTISLSGASNNVGGVWIGSTSAVASGTGTKVCEYDNSLSGGLVVGLTLGTKQTVACTVALPANWYLAVRQTAGSGMSVSSAFDQVAQ